MDEDVAEDDSLHGPSEEDVVALVVEEGEEGVVPGRLLLVASLLLLKMVKG